MDDGMGPVILLKDKSRSVNEGGRMGIDPDREFNVTSKLVKEDKWESAGIDPCKRFKLRMMFLKFADRRSGMVPVIFVLRISNVSNPLRVFKEDGISPQMLFNDNVITRRVVK
jgi:hypothetical protein